MPTTEAKFLWRVTLCFVLIALSARTSAAQTPAGSPPAVPTPTALPLTAQIKKTVVFLDTSCLHDYTGDVASLTKQWLLQMPVEQQLSITKQLEQLTTRLLSVSIIKAKLTGAELLSLHNPNDPNQPDRSALADKAIQKAILLKKMTSLSQAEIRSLTPAELALLPVDEHLGTGFFVSVPEPRIPQIGGKGEVTGFPYLITNRHVAEPGSESDHPCEIVGTSMLINKKESYSSGGPRTENVQLGNAVPWTFPEDPSVDLATMPMQPPVDMYDYVVVKTDQFVTDDDVKTHALVEGDPVLFSGLFIQSFREVHSLEPIVRAGTLAMLPETPLETTMNGRFGHVYLADAHAFGGNSGSPIFVDVSRFAGAIGFNYKLLGVISGEMYENSDLTFNVTTTLTANSAANSDVSMLVPAQEVLNLLNSKNLKDARDRAVEVALHPK
jgi:hypothetical protein